MKIILFICSVIATPLLAQRQEVGPGTGEGIEVIVVTGPRIPGGTPDSGVGPGSVIVPGAGGGGAGSSGAGIKATKEATKEASKEKIKMMAKLTKKASLFGFLSWAFDVDFKAHLNLEMKFEKKSGEEAEVSYSAGGKIEVGVGGGEPSNFGPDSDLKRRQDILNKIDFRIYMTKAYSELGMYHLTISTGLRDSNGLYNTSQEQTAHFFVDSIAEAEELISELHDDLIE